MTKKILNRILLAALMVFGGLSAAYAKSGYLTTFNTTYGTSGTVLNTCSLCHPGGTTSQKNAFALAYAGSGYSFAAIQSADSDGDGYSNITEINARTFPGDPNSKPVATDTTAPTVTGFSIPATSTSLTVAISGYTATDNIGVTGYLVNESSTKPLATATGWATTPKTSYTFATAGTKTLYAWAKDAAGNVSAAKSASVTITVAATTDTTAPSAPSGLTAVVSGSNSVMLSWNVSSDNVGVTGYQIFRNGSQVGTSSQTGYTDGSVLASTAYSYSVKAKDAAGNVSASSNTATVTTQAGSGGQTTGLSGEFFTNNFGMATDEPYIRDGQYSMKFDGSGNFTYSSRTTSTGLADNGSGMCKVTGGLLSFGSGSGMGIASPDGKALAWTDTYQEADGYMGIGVGFKKSANMTNASLKGKFYVGGVTVSGGDDDDDDGTAASYLMKVDFKGDGTLTYNYVRKSTGSVSTDSRPGKYRVKSDGTVEVEMDGMKFKGVLKDDGKVLSLVDAAAADGTLGIGVGVAVSSGKTLSSLSGPYVVIQAGFLGDYPWTGVTEMNFGGTGYYTASDSYSSDGKGHTPGGGYSVKSDGQVSTNKGDTGILSPDGLVFMTVDAKPSDGMIGLKVGIRKQK